MIEVRINGYECDPGEIEIGTAGSYGVQQLHFAFSSEWEGLTRRTTWMTDAGKIAVLLDESDTMTVPAEATATAGRRWLSVDGVAAGKQMISVRMGYKVYETVEPGGENSVTPTDEEMTQALAILEEVKALKTPEITVGKTETVEAGTPARVENTGTATKAVLDFEIPRGESGVYVGADEPDETAKVWVDPEGENDAEGAVIDLNAAVQEAREAAEEAGRVVEGAASEFEQMEARMTALKQASEESATSAKKSADAAKSSASGAGGSLTHSVSAMKRAAVYAEGGTESATLIGNVSYPAIDTIGAKGYMEQAKAASESAGSEKDAAEAARAAAEAAESGAIAAKNAAEAAVLNGPKIENDTWWVYDAAKQTYVDTGVDASGLAGQPGSDGKTAYQYAQDGGYTGSETEFAAKLAAEHLPVPATAAVGQYFRAKTVGDNGLVTEVEAVDAPTGGGSDQGHWETVLETTWDMPVVKPTAYDAGTGIFTCAEGELDALELNTQYTFYQQCNVENVAYNTILNENWITLTKLSDTTFSIDATPGGTFVATNVKFSKAASIAVTDINTKKIRLTLDGQFLAAATLYERPFYGANQTYFGKNVGYQKIRSAYQAYQQVTAEVESPYRIVGEILCGFNAPSQNGSFHFKYNSFCCPLVPNYDKNTRIFSSDGQTIKNLYSTPVPWMLGSENNNGLQNDYLKIISGTKVKLERWVE